MRALAERLHRSPPPDAVVSNAAVIPRERRPTAEGLDETLAVNHLAPCLLLQLPARRSGECPARFVVVGASPTVLRLAPVDLDDLAFERSRFSGLRAYGRTKNMNAMFTYALARRPAGTGITVSGARPGIIRDSGLGGEATGSTRLFGALFAPVTGTVRDGADPRAGRPPPGTRRSDRRLQRQAPGAHRRAQALRAPVAPGRRTGPPVEDEHARR